MNEGRTAFAAGEREVAGVVELHRSGEEGLEADGAGGGLLEGEALFLLVLRGVEGADDVDEAVREGGLFAFTPPVLSGN